MEAQDLGITDIGASPDRLAVHFHPAVFQEEVLNENGRSSMFPTS